MSVVRNLGTESPVRVDLVFKYQLVIRLGSMKCVVVQFVVIVRICLGTSFNGRVWLGESL